jgi:hypothetical protein
MGGRFGPPTRDRANDVLFDGSSNDALGAVTRVACVRVFIDLLRI